MWCRRDTCGQAERGNDVEHLELAADVVLVTEVAHQGFGEGDDPPHNHLPQFFAVLAEPRQRLHPTPCPSPSTSLAFLQTPLQGQAVIYTFCTKLPKGPGQDSGTNLCACPPVLLPEEDKKPE